MPLVAYIGQIPHPQIAVALNSCFVFNTGNDDIL